MTDSVEVAITSESSGQLWSVSVWDILTGSQLKTYKSGGVSGRHALSLVGSDYIVSAEVSKPVLHVWPINSSEPSHELKTICPGIIGALAVSPNGKYIAAGIAEKIHLWQVEAGRLMCVAVRHFQQVTCIRFIEDGSHFVSAGEDGMVLVWSISDLVAQDGVRLETTHSFSDHYLPVKDVFVGKGGYGTRIVSVSLDGSCRVYDFGSGKLLLSLVVDSGGLTSVTADVLESSLFLGCSSGDILMVSLCESQRQVEHHLTEQEKESVFKGHTQAVTSLSTSQDTTSLLSASVDESVRLWHIESRQCLRIIQHKGAVNNAFITFIPPKMFSEKLKPSVVMHRLQRVNDAAASQDFSFEVMVTEEQPFSTSCTSFKNVFVPVLGPIEDSSTVSSEELSAKCKEIEDIRKKNSDLFEFACKKIIGSNENGKPKLVIPSLVDVNAALSQVELNSLDIEPVYRLSKKIKKNKKVKGNH